MAGISGRRKALIVLAFILPTILGILVFNVYPMILNTYISFTNKNKFRPNPDCTNPLNDLLVPTCWDVFEENAPVGLGQPFTFAEPILANYQTLIGDLFTPNVLLALLSIVVCIVPLFIGARIDKRLDQQLERKIPSILVWMLAIIAGILLAAVLNIVAAFDTLMESGDFVVVIFRTILFVILRVPFSFLIGLTFAIILSNEFMRGRNFFRVILFIPWAASTVAILMALVWQFFFREQGTVNQILALLGVEGQVWLRDPLYAFGIVVLVDVWFSYPFFMMAIGGALTSIPGELYEAAEVDGAGWWSQLRSITLPMIRPAILPAIVLTSITAFQMFGTVWALTQGGPVQSAGKPGATEFVMIYAYKQIFQSQNHGLATAFAVIVFIFLFSATLYSLRMTRITKGAFE